MKRIELLWGIRFSPITFGSIFISYRKQSGNMWKRSKRNCQKVIFTRFTNISGRLRRRTLRLFHLAIGYINYKHKLYTDTTHHHIFLKDTERMGSGDILNKIASYYNSKINSFRRCKHSHSFVGLKVFLFCIVFFARVYKCTNKAVCCYAT